jgi:UDP-glucuronate 4-epimerase
MIMEPMQPGDVKATCADITAIETDYGYIPKTELDTGIPAFVDWYRSEYLPVIATG